MCDDIAKHAAQIFFGVPAQILRNKQDITRQREVPLGVHFTPRCFTGGSHAHGQRRGEFKGGCCRVLAGAHFTAVQNFEAEAKGDDVEADCFAGVRYQPLTCPRRAPQQMIQRGGEWL